MEALSETGKLHKWVFEKIKPWLKGKILELNSGNGDLAVFFAQEGIRLRLSDPNDHCYRLLQGKFGKKEAIKGIHRVSIEREDFEKSHLKMFEKFDTVLLLNINSIDHNLITPQAIVNAKKLLKTNGHLIVSLRSNTALYDDSNLGFEEWRRQNWKLIRKIFGRDLDILTTKFFEIATNQPDNSSDLSSSKEGKVKPLYREKVEFFHVADETTFHKLGLSMIVLGRKNEKNNSAFKNAI